MQNSVSRSIEKTLWPEYPIWGLRAWQGGWGLGVCVVTLVARLPWLICSASTPRGAASCLHSMGSALPALRRTVDLQKKSQSLVVLSCHRPGGSQRTLGAAQKGAAWAARQPPAQPRDQLPVGTVPASLPGKGCCIERQPGTPSPCSARLKLSLVSWVASLGRWDLKHGSKW